MADRQEYDLVCIGSGPAGQRAAVQAAKLGKRVAVVERHRAIGHERPFRDTTSPVALVKS